MRLTVDDERLQTIERIKPGLPISNRSEVVIDAPTPNQEERSDPHPQISLRYQPLASKACGDSTLPSSLTPTDTIGIASPDPGQDRERLQGRQFSGWRDEHEATCRPIPRGPGGLTARGTEAYHRPTG